MAQTFTDDCFAASHVAQTDMQNIENNLTTLKSCFSGASAPSNPVAGMLYYNTSDSLMYQRNAANTAWVLITAGFCNTTVVAGSGVTVSGTLLTGNVTVSHTAHTGDVTGSGALTIADGRVTVTKIQAGTLHSLPSYGPVDDEYIEIDYDASYDTDDAGIIRNRIYLPAGAQTLNGTIKLARGGSSGWVGARLYCGGLTTAAQTTSSGTPGWLNYSLDVSSLSGWQDLFWQIAADTSASYPRVYGYAFYWSY
jgi:hypothetical protein